MINKASYVLRFVVAMAALLSTPAFSADHALQVKLAEHEVTITPTARGAVVSPDDRHCAWIEREGRAEYVNLDGDRGKPYDHVEYVQFSAKGNHLAYLAFVGMPPRPAKCCLVVDGVESPFYNGLTGRPFSPGPNSTHICFTPARDHTQYAVVDTREVTATNPLIGYSTAYPVIFSPDGNHIAFISGGWHNVHVVMDGVSGRTVESIDSISFSADGKHLSYTAKKGDIHMRVIDGQIVCQCKGAYTICFGPDGRHYAACVFVRGRFQLIVDGKEIQVPTTASPWSFTYSPDGKHLICQAQLEIVTEASRRTLLDGHVTNITIGPVFSPDGAHMVYFVNKDDHSGVVVRDGKEENRYADIYDPVYPVASKRAISDITFSPDSRHVAYIARFDNARAVVRDGKEGARYRDVSGITFSPDSRHVAYVASLNGSQTVVLDGRELGEFRPVDDSTLTFSPDSKHIAYMVGTVRDRRMLNRASPSQLMLMGNRAVGHLVVDCTESDTPMEGDYGFAFDGPATLHYITGSYPNGLARVEVRISDAK
jgi:Tol biopolymer transport system component